MFPGNQSLPLGIGFPPPPLPPPPVLPGTTTSAVRNAPQSSAISHAFQKPGNERTGRCVQGSSGGLIVDHGLRKQSSSSDERGGTEEDMRPVSRDCYSTGMGSLRMSRHSYVSSLPSPLGSGNTSHQADASPSPIRGFQPYRAGEESSLSTLPAFPLPAFPIVDPRFDSFHGSLDVSNAFSLSSYRYDDSLVLDCYPQFPYPHAGLLPTSGIHPLLSPLLRYPADFLTQQYMSSYLSNVSQMASGTSDGRLLSEELRRLSSGKDKDREKDKDQERQQERKKEKEQDWLRERQEWEKQEAKMKMNGISSNGLGPVQSQGQALSLVTQLGELSAAVSRVESQRCSGLREAMYSSSLISSQAFAPKPETMEAFKNLLPKVPDERLKSSTHGSRELLKKEDNDSASMNGQRNWFARMTSTSPGSVTQDPLQEPSSDLNSKRRVPATFHRPFEVAPVNGCGKELPRTKIQKEKSEKTVVVAPGLNSYKSLNMLGTVTMDHKLSTAPLISTKVQTQFTMESGSQHNNKRTKDRPDGSRLEVKRSDDRSVEQIQRSQFESFLENLNSKGRKFQQKRRQTAEQQSKTVKTPDAVNCTRKDKAAELLALERMKYLTRDTPLQPPSKKPCLPPKTVPELCLRSRLDDRERKLVEARKNGTHVSDDVSDNENILADDVTHQKLLLIYSGPPLRMMRSKRKMDFLKEFGLMTHLEDKEFKFHQERKRRRLHFQRNLSPTEMENAPPDAVATLPTKLTTCEDLNMQDDFRHKACFLHKMGLMPTLPEHRKKAKLMRHGCLSERKKNGDAAGSTAKLTPLNHFANGQITNSELPKREDASHLLSSRWPSVQETTSPSVSCRLVPLSKSSGSHQARNSKLPVNPLKTHSTLVPGTGENEKTLTAKLKDIASCSSAVQLCSRTPDVPNGRDPVEDNMRGPGQQLVTSSKGQMSNWQLPRNSQDSSTTKPQRCDGDMAMPVTAAMITKWTGTPPASASEETRNRQHTNGQHSESLDWPGISVLIDAYHRYQGEQRLERRILKEQRSRMQTKNHELQFKRDSLAKHISDLKQTKEALEKERNMIQNTVDCLKKCLKLSLLW